jgi:hypothetical protein
MTTVDDLRHSLEGHAMLAPDATGLVEAAQAGAARIHRRRRITAIVTAAVLVVAAAVAVPVTWRLRAAPVAPAVTGPHIPIGRKAQEMTLAIDPGFPASTVLQATDFESQRINVEQRSGSKIVFSADIHAWEPSVIGSVGGLPTGAIVERITVAGHAAEYVTTPPATRGGPAPDPSVRWTEPTGVYVRVTQDYGTADRARLLALAAAVHIGPAHPLLMPFQIARIPAGEQVVSASAGETSVAGEPAALTLSASGNVEARLLLIYAEDKIPLERVAGGPFGGPTPVAPIGGRRAWKAAKERWMASMPSHESTDALVVDAGSYWAIFSSSPELSAEQVRQVASSTTFATFTDKSSWLPPVG